MLRTLLGDVTLRPGPDPGRLRVGLRWNSGATEELIVARARPVTEWRRARRRSPWPGNWDRG